MRDYGIKTDPRTPNELVRTVIEGFGQQPSHNPMETDCSDREVYRCAVWAIGSIGRTWIRFLQAEPEIKRLLKDYDTTAVARAVQTGELRQQDLIPLLPGQTQKKDASAILEWGASYLQHWQGYYDRVVGELAGEMLRRSADLQPHELLLCIAGHIGYSRAGVKAPGMGYAIASEFLRNLRWNGFKPDRHVRRLFDRWNLGGLLDVGAQTERLSQISGNHESAYRNDYLRYSLWGIQITPDGYSFTETDNRIWLLGNYVEAKGRESAETYLVHT